VRRTNVEVLHESDAVQNSGLSTRCVVLSSLPCQHQFSSLAATVQLMYAQFLSVAILFFSWKTSSFFLKYCSRNAIVALALRLNVFVHLWLSLVQLSSFGNLLSRL
jgi:hypothetical protein